ncbi:LacI family DNA-binding transcriptional regulator [Luteococcus sp. H138]|uniref:LacI family DNA-binding transcriptional regulator n=1 Tax=unclassified Luteococcus TaxID=2639923 RepID=UPI00313A9F11
MADKVTIDDVAKRAGVHRSTVSRAFSKPDSVNEKTRRHVLAVAEELGYAMSPLAQALRRQSSAFVPLIVPDVLNPFFAELANSVSQAAQRRGYQLVMCITNGDADRTMHYLEMMNSLMSPFGVIAPSTRLDLEELTSTPFGRRVVVIDRVAPSSPSPSVSVDSHRGIELAFEHLRSLGHSRIGYVSGISGTHTSQERLKSYLEHAGNDSLLLDDGTDANAGLRAAAHFQSMQDKPSAIIAANDLTAMSLIAELAKRGFKTPADVSVIGFDGLDLGGRCNPGLTTIRQPIEQLGDIALDLALKSVDHGVTEHISLTPDLLVRSSTSPLEPR